MINHRPRDHGVKRLLSSFLSVWLTLGGLFAVLAPPVRVEASDSIRVGVRPVSTSPPDVIDDLLASAKRKQAANRAALYKPDDGFSD